MMARVPATGLRTYPDLSALCVQPVIYPGEISPTNPTVIIEVVSPSTERWDRGGIFAHCRRLASMLEYILASQDEMRAELYTRQSDVTWALAEFIGPDAVPPLNAIRCELPLAKIYEHLGLSPLPCQP